MRSFSGESRNGKGYGVHKEVQFKSGGQGVDLNPNSLPHTPQDAPPPPPPVKKRGKIAELWHNYGLLFLGTYSFTYLATLGTFYVLVDNHFLDIASMGITYDSAIEQVTTV